MQPPIPPGTILQNRYRVTKLLGIGGFGRTYLAEEQDRFNEICVIKEFNPTDIGTEVLEKSKELFHREAAVLYKIQHPQIPKFRAAFEQGKRLFLVQDFVDGRTYAALLEERLEQGKTFSEVEAIEFLQQILPVLEYVHTQGIIHRDISLDNIILRDRDRLPILIDFGVVKAGLAKLPSSQQLTHATTVGKLGYAPNEQLQTGQVSPNSDLYALAVSVVVMMTGRKPEKLLDESTMTWRWHQWLPSITPWFAKVLNRMLSLRPNNRYQSASEVIQALRALEGLVAKTSPDVKNSGANPPIPLHKVTRRATPVRPQPAKKTFNFQFNSPWILVGLISGVFLLLAIVPVMLLGSMFPTSNLQVSPRLAKALKGSKVSSPTPVAGLSPSPTPSTVGQSETINLVLGQATSKQGRLVANNNITYVIAAQQGQQLNTSVVKGGVTITVLAPSKELLSFQTKQVPRWEGILPVAGEYYVQLNLIDGVSESDYLLDINLTNPSEAVPTSSPIPTTSSTTTPSPTSSPFPSTSSTPTPSP
ncbi:MAG TPA: protein kinase [Oculatellaceae cyanobacterium]|jgi:serine/threonine-protein kinase